MLTGITLAENEDFTSSHDDAPDGEKTVFVIGAIDVFARSFIQDNVTVWRQTDEGMVILNRTAQRNFELCRFGIKDIKNFKDATKEGTRIENGAKDPRPADRS